MKAYLGIIIIGVLFGSSRSILSETLDLPLGSKTDSETSLNCSDFRSIFGFIQEQHLRIQNLSVQEKEVLLQEAESQIPDALIILGHPMMANWFSRTMLSRMKKWGS